MWKRIVLDTIGIMLVFFAPWWIALVFGIVGILFFSWYGEIIFLGMLYDVLFGGIIGPWYYHIIHTGIFTAVLLLGEFIKTQINTRSFYAKPF